MTSPSTASLRWRQRLFLAGPMAAFALLASVVVWLRSGGASQMAPDFVAWIAAAAIVVATLTCGFSLWWAPTARCPACKARVGRSGLSAPTSQWVWQSQPRCAACGAKLLSRGPRSAPRS